MDKGGLMDLFKVTSEYDITLDYVFTDGKNLIVDYISKQNRQIIKAGSLLMVIVNLFWLVFELVTPGKTHDIFYLLGLTLCTIAEALMLIFTWRRRKPDPKRARTVQLVFQLSTILMVLFLETTRSHSLASDVHLVSNGVSLSAYWLILCALVPMYSNLDSILCMAALVGSAFVPIWICPAGSYQFTSNLIISICVCIGYFVFRIYTLNNAGLVKTLANTSYRDHQTGTLNRRAMKEYFASLKEKDVEKISIIMFDIDDLKSYNDQYSFAKGDIIIRRISETIMDLLEPTGVLLFSYGGGEFVAVVEDETDEDVLKLAIRIKQAVAGLGLERNDDTGMNHVTVTVGCATASKNESIERDIIGDAEAQLFIGKRGAKDCVVFKGRIYLAEGEIEIAHQPTLYTERVAQAVNEAMKNREIQAFYQPLHDTTTHKLVGAEALCRWLRDDGTMILPSEFVPELEKNSSILPLDWYMFEESCRMLSRQRELGIPQVRISVNFSRMHALYERSIEKRLCEIADSYSIPHHLIEIEITESAYIHLPSIIEPFIRKIRAAGFAVAVDDFGSGASSLEFIKSVDVDTLKIDKSLISSNCTDEKERVLLESVVFLAHRLQLNAVAEGVETMEQLGFLKTLGCNQIQGFIFEPPLSESDFLAICKEQAVEVSDQEFAQSHKQTSMMQLLMETVLKEYQIVVVSNLSRDSFYTMSYSSITSHSYAKAGALSELISDIAQTMHPDDVERFRETFDFESQMERYRKGEEKIIFCGRIHGDENPFSYTNIETSNYFIKESGNDDLIVISFINIVS